jgi:coenzyme PQQ synthesis protein D (PqqD)
MPATKPKRRDELAITEIGDELVVYDPLLDRFHHLSSSAALVFGLCDGTATMKETAGELAEVTGERPEEIEQQVRKLVRELRRSELLERNPTKEEEEALAKAEAAAKEGASDERERIRMQVPRSS